MSKIDTQGMSGPVDPTYRGKDNIYPRDADGNPIYPPANETEIKINSNANRVSTYLIGINLFIHPMLFFSNQHTFDHKPFLHVLLS